jgi:dolichol-phosphate mannosyltransferase
MNDLILFPFNGNAKEAVNIILDLNSSEKKWNLLGFIDDNSSIWGKQFLDYPVLGGRERLKEHQSAKVLAVVGRFANHLQRKEIIDSLSLQPEQFATIIHPSANIAQDTHIGYNCLIMAGVITTANVYIGNHCIILPNTVVSHDVHIEPYCLIGSGVAISGGVRINASSYIGAGSRLIENIQIGEGAATGIGSVVLKSIPPYTIVVGHPAQVLRSQQKMISFVIPAYNESLNIQKTIEDIIDALKLSSNTSAFEIIVVDDHSSDDTFERVKNLNINEAHAIRLSRRSGSHTAIRAGIQEAHGDAVICISADGQDDPAIIPNMIEKWKQGAHIVWALRRSRHNEPWLISIPARIFYYLLHYMSPQQMSHPSIDLSRADFYLLDKTATYAINACKESKTSLFGLIIWSGFNQDFVEYDRKARRYGQSKWNFSSRLNLAKDWIMAFSGLPLKIMMWLGVFFAVAGFVYALFIVFAHFLFGHSVKGWSSLIIAVLFLGGLNICMLGLIGEYLWRTLEESRKRPLYFIEKKSKQRKKE